MTTLRKEPVSKLGIKLQNYRCDRPDEWTMDEFTREAELMQEQVAELRSLVERSIDRLNDCISQDDGQAYKEAEKFIDIASRALEATE